MANFYDDNDDLKFYVEKAIGWDTLVRVTENEFRLPGAFNSTQEAVDFYREILGSVGRFVADEIAPFAAEIDHDAIRLEGGEVVFSERLQRVFDRIREMDLHGMCLPRELGGMNVPLVIYYLNAEMFARGDVSVMVHHSFHGGMALAMLLFSLREGSTKLDSKTGAFLETRFRTALAEIARGEAWGCMDITEPDAGSDMAALRTRAELGADGTWRITGQKIFITSGHAKYHFVIARTEKAGANGSAEDEADDFAAGLRGLSMFLVPAYSEENGERKRVVRIGRVEEKLGHHASATCQIEFDGAPAELIGRRGEGFEYMLMLMNGARLGVGFECLGLAEAAYRMAAGYAAERKSMGRALDQHELIADYLDEMRVDIAGLRALCMRGAIEEETGYKKELLASHVEMDKARREQLLREAEAHKKAARRFTPLIKYFGGEKAVEIARRCLQIHGGVGYMREYKAEKLLRDSIAMPIYEGTSQIQSLMAMKDTLGAVFKDPKGFVRRQMRARWSSTWATDPLERRVARLQLLSFRAQRRLIFRTAGDRLKLAQDLPLSEWVGFLARRAWDPKRDFAFALLHAERLTKVLADEAIAECLLVQAKLHPERRSLCERYVERAEPRVRRLLDEISMTGDHVLRRLGRVRGAPSPASGSPEARADL